MLQVHNIKILLDDVVVDEFNTVDIEDIHDYFHNPDLERVMEPHFTATPEEIDEYYAQLDGAEGAE